MQVTIGNVVITDGGNNDLDQANNVIKFDSGAPNAGFALPQNSSVRRIRGVVKLAVVGSVVQFLPPGAVSLVLTDLRVSSQQGAGNQSLTVVFEHDFAGPPAPVTAGETLEGSFSDMSGVSMNGSSVTWSAFVNGARIQPPNAPFTQLNGAGAAANVPIGPRSGGPMPIAGGGPPWTLKGELIVLLASSAHTVTLPNSAEIGIAPAMRPHEQQQQVPSTQP